MVTVAAFVVILIIHNFIGQRAFSTAKVEIEEVESESTKFLNKIFGETPEDKETSISIALGALGLIITSKLILDYKHRCRPAEAEEKYFQYGVSNITRHDPTG